MGLTERHWFENEDVPENYEWDLEDAVYNSNKKHDDDIVRCKDCEYSLFKEGVVPPGHIVCTKPFTERWQVVKPDNWFCADGNRR